MPRSNLLTIAEMIRIVFFLVTRLSVYRIFGRRCSMLPVSLNTIMIEEWVSLHRALSLVSFSLSVPVAFPIPVVTVDFHTQDLLSCKSPKGLRVIPSFGGVRECVVGNLIIVGVEGVRSFPRVACPGTHSRVRHKCAVKCGTANLPPIVPEVAVHEKIGTSKRAVLEISRL